MNTVFALVAARGGLADKSVQKLLEVAYKKWVAFLYISLFLRGGGLK